MMTRCTNAQTVAYKDYGGRGIKVCERWKDFENFLADMGRCPSEHSLERKNNDGDYTPENCRWATHLQQMSNTRRCRKITHNGRTQHLAAWARELGIPRQRIQHRLRLGWTVAEAFT